MEMRFRECATLNDHVVSSSLVGAQFNHNFSHVVFSQINARLRIAIMQTHVAIDTIGNEFYQIGFTFAGERETLSSYFASSFLKDVAYYFLLCHILFCCTNFRLQRKS